MGSLVQTLNLFRVLPNFVKEDLLIVNFMIEYFVIIFNLVM
jgi:hypothetical protein